MAQARTPARTLLLFTFAAALVYAAGNTFEDPQGRLVIDMPSGWAAEPQAQDTVFVLKGDGKSIIIEYVPGVTDVGELIKKAESTLRASGLTSLTAAGGVFDMTINGHPARWVTFHSGPLLGSFTGAVALGEDGLYFLAIMAQANLEKSRTAIEGSFHSLRRPGEQLVGATDVRASVSPTAPAPMPTPWSSDLVALTLPPGWTEKPLPRGFEKEVKGLFASEELPGATLTVVCYKGLGMNMAKVYDAGLKSVTIPMPGLKPVEATEVKLANRTANLTVFRGMAAGAGTEVELASVVVTAKGRKSFVNLLFTGPATLPAELRRHALATAESIE